VAERATPARRRRADALRNAQVIADAAMRVLADHPGASMAEIADASGLGRATLYRHFATRADLVRVIQARAMDAGAVAHAAADLDRGDAVDALRRAIAALVAVGERFRLLAGEAALDPTRMQYRPEVAGRLLAVVERGQRTGELRDDLPATWVVSALSALLGVALRSLADRDLGRQDAAAWVAATLLDGITSPQPPA